MGLTLKWGIIGTGSIAKTFAKGLNASRTGKLIAIGSRTKEKAELFRKEFNIKKCYGNYDELLEDKEVQAVYISTPHPLHAEWAKKAALAKKHILCEKPLTLNYAEAKEVCNAAKKNNVFLMEAFMYRCHPQTIKLVELLKKKVIGEVRIIQATFSYHAKFNAKSRIFSNELGGGGILDVGCYCVSLVRLVSGISIGKTFAEPIKISASGHLGKTGVDEWATSLMTFPKDIIAVVSTGISVEQENIVKIFGDKGSIILTSPWFANGEIIIKNKNKTTKFFFTNSTRNELYAIEADTFAECLKNKKAISPTMSTNDSLGNMLALDKWRKSIGFLYNSEKK